MADGFTLYLLRSGRKPSTVHLYADAIRHLRARFPTLSQDEIEVYMYDLLEKGRKATYLKKFVDALHVYGKYTNTVWMQELKRFKVKESVKATMSDEEIEQFLSLPHPGRGSDYQGYANWTMFFTIMAYSGMRTGEVASLTVENVDFGREVFVLEDTKTTPRYVPIAPTIANKLGDYIKGLRTQHLFPSNGKSGVYDRFAWHYSFHSRIDRMGIKRTNLTPCSLRHSFITRLLSEDVNLFKVQKIVGHKKIETTARYTHLTTKDLLLTIRKDPLVKKSILPKEVIDNLLETIRITGIEADGRFDYLKVKEAIHELTMKLHASLI